jgi:hypothetical protein
MCKTIIGASISTFIIIIVIVIIIIIIINRIVWTNNVQIIWLQYDSYKAYLLHTIITYLLHMIITYLLHKIITYSYDYYYKVLHLPLASSFL